MTALTPPVTPSLSSAPAQVPGLLRRWADAFVDPAVFDFWVGRINPLWTWQRPLARVVERHAAAAGAVTLILQPNRHWRGFTPGQHLNLGVEIEGRRVSRTYSLCDVPRADGRIAVTVQQIDGGLMSTHLCTKTQVGDVLDLGPAFGELCLPKQSQGRQLMLAAGSGITPLMSLCREMAARQMPQPLTLMYWVKTAEQACFVAELRALAQGFANFKFELITTKQGGRRIDAEQLALELAPGGADLQVYACGPGGFAAQARDLLSAQVQSFKAEAFTPAVPLNTDSKHQVQVQLRRSGRTLEVASGLSLLAALEAQGVRPQSGCRMGICHSCVCTQHEGLTEDMNTGERISEPNSAIRICVSRACTDISLDL